ncbi:hypothetical protein ILUMI_20446 [Ignelater luminosus]|uniref:Uncharacterized protein n=1 Tax=Ignelater luminosus TaxID=2038154 RepID=A0A8K0CKN8_IGNLU|nr:hypothetical protein ILUMI_20446 [Ignelater luminosus]
MKTLIILTSVIAIAIAQRPGYLGSGPIGYPGLASRFQTESTSTAPSAAPENVNNRLGETDGTTQRIPVDARGDVDLVNRLNQWPRENRPFWILNAEHIERQRNPQGQTIQGGVIAPQNIPTRGSFNEFGNAGQTQTIRPLQSRGSFAGSLR